MDGLSVRDGHEGEDPHGTEEGQGEVEKQEESIDGRQLDEADAHSDHEVDLSSEFDEGRMIDCIQPEEDEAGAVPGSSSSGSIGSANSVVTMSSTDLFDLVEASQEKIGRMLLSEQTAALGRRSKNVEVNQAKLLNSEFHTLRQELQKNLDHKMNDRMTAAEQRLQAMVKTANNVAEEAKTAAERSAAAMGDGGGVGGRSVHQPQGEQCQRMGPENIGGQGLLHVWRQVLSWGSAEDAGEYMEAHRRAMNDQDAEGIKWDPVRRGSPGVARATSVVSACRSILMNHCRVERRRELEDETRVRPGQLDRLGLECGGGGRGQERPPPEGDDDHDDRRRRQMDTGCRVGAKDELEVVRGGVHHIGSVQRP